MAWITVRRRRARSALSAVAFYDQSDVGHGAVLYPTVASVPRLYVRVFFSISADNVWSNKGIARELLILLPRTHLTQARTRPKHHPQSSAQRTTAASSLTLNHPFDLLDRCSQAYPKCERAEHHILLSSCYSRIKLTPACLYLNIIVGMRCLSICLLTVYAVSLFLKMAQT